MPGSQARVLICIPKLELGGADDLLAKAIERQLTNREVARKCAAQAMAAIERLAQNPAADQLVTIYHALLAGRPGR